MNRRGFLTQLFQGAIVAVATPQIVTHGLKLWVPKYESCQLDYVANQIGIRAQLRKVDPNGFWFQPHPITLCYTDEFKATLDQMLAVVDQRKRDGLVSDRIEVITDQRGKEWAEQWL